MSDMFLNGMTILVVDDEEILAEIVCEEIEAWGANVIMASDGEEALEVVRSQKIDLIVTDQSMPGMTGLELAEEAKNCENYLNKAFILLTGYTEDDIAAKAPKLMDSITVVNKPIDPDELKAALESRVEPIKSAA